MIWSGSLLGAHATAEKPGDSWIGGLRYGAASTVAAPANRCYAARAQRR